MAAGKPVIASNMGQLAQVIRHGDNGMLVPDDSEAIVETLCMLKADREGECIWACRPGGMSSAITTGTVLRRRPRQRLRLCAGNFSDAADESDDVKVLMVVGQYHPITGGTEMECRKLASGLARRGIGVTVLTQHCAGLPDL